MKYILSGFLHFISAFYMGLKSIYWSLAPVNNVTINVLENVKLRFSKKGEIAKILFLQDHLLFKKRSFEYLTLSKFKSLLGTNQVILDIGANVGLFSLMAARLQPSSTVYAFEPKQMILETLDKNLQLNKVNNVHTYRLALSDKKGEISLVTPKNEHSDAFSHIANGVVNENGEQWVEKVPMTTIDHFLTENRIEKVDIIKIDIEGAELLCLKGMKSLLSGVHKPSIIFECSERWTLERYQYSTYDLLHYLAQYGYQLRQIENEQFLAVDKK